jgi:hypothetical protein
VSDVPKVVLDVGDDAAMGRLVTVWSMRRWGLGHPGRYHSLLGSGSARRCDPRPPRR